MIDIRLQHPFTFVLSGPTGCGKTNFLTNLLINGDSLFNIKIDRLIYCYGVPLPETFNKLKNKYPHLELIHGLNPDLEFNPQLNNILILDDLMVDCVKSDVVLKYFTRGSHHESLSVILLTQNLFHQGTHSRTINRNSHYVAFFKNPRDQSSIEYLARQMYPKKSNILIEAYHDATSRPYGYIFIDLKQETNDDYRIRTNILPSDPTPAVIYIPRNASSKI